MNKEKFIEELMSITSYNKNECEIINDVLENHFIIGKNNKCKILKELMIKLSLEEKEAENIYETSIDILLKGIKNRIKNPLNFR